MRIVKPPEFYNNDRERSIFLAGSIEQGSARNWQQEFINKYETTLLGKGHGGVGDSNIIYNPRRDDWDDTWKQEVSNPPFFQQVVWEMTYLERADRKIFYFCTDTLSPITLWEFGKYHNIANSYVCIEEGYKRKGNLEVISFLHNIRLYENMDEIISKLL